MRDQLAAWTLPIAAAAVLWILSPTDRMFLTPSASGHPLLIAHRGASGHRPEHTLAAYELAIAQGADYIEPDVVSTKDGVLIARHENEMGGTTDVAVKFPNRQTTKRIDGVDVTGWFSEDFTLDEIKSLRAKERLPFRSHAFDGQFEVPTLDEVIALAVRESHTRGRVIGVYPETKHPTYFRELGLPLEERLLDRLQRQGWDTRDAPVFVQSFEVGNLRALRARTHLRLVQLLAEGGAPYDLAVAGDRRTYADLASPVGLREIARYADGIGANTRLILPMDDAGRLHDATSLVHDAHDAGLFVHVWTLRAEPVFLPKVYDGDLGREVRRFADLGVDGLFTDFPDIAFAALQRP